MYSILFYDFEQISFGANTIWKERQGIIVTVKWNRRPELLHKRRSGINAILEILSLKNDDTLSLPKDQTINNVYIS